MNLAFFAVAMTVLIGLAGYASDTGMIWVSRSRLQHSVDAAALAAAQELPADDAAASAAARDVACEFSTEHNDVSGMFGKTATCGGEADVDFLEEGTEVRVTAYRTVVPMFGRVLGFQEVEVSAQATARIGSIGRTCIFPLFLTTDQVENSEDFYVPVKFSEADTAIDVGSGSQAVRDAMADLECEGNSPTSFFASVGTEVDVKPGSATEFKAGWDAIKNDALAPGSACPNADISQYTQQDEAGRTELLPTITMENCPRLILVPILPEGNYGGNSTGVIQGFIPFFFYDVCGAPQGCTVPGITGRVRRHKAWGVYVNMEVTSLTYSDYNPATGTKIVSLAE